MGRRIVAKDWAAMVRQSFPALDDQQRTAVIEFVQLLFDELDPSGEQVDAADLVRTEEVVRAAADVLRAMVIAAPLARRL